MRRGSVFLVLWLCLMQKVDADVTNKAMVEIKFIQFNNAVGRTATGDKCDLWIVEDCETKFEFCLESFDGPRSCSTSGVYDSTNSVTFGSSMKGVANPMVLSLPSWPGSVDLSVTVTDIDVSSHDLIDNFVHSFSVGQPKVNGDKDNKTRVVLTGKRNRSPTSLELTYAIKCTASYYGPSCTTFCEPRTGHSECQEPSGNKLCLTGWKNPESDCLDPVCTPESCHNGGQCRVVGNDFECDCPALFHGDHCEFSAACINNLCQNNANCVPHSNGVNYTCDCVNGFTGVYCDSDVRQEDDEEN